MEVRTIGLDLAKSVFQLHGVDAKGRVVVRKRLTREKVLRFVANLRCCVVGMEACASAHYWGREIQKLLCRHGSDPRLAGQKPPGHCARPRGNIPQKELPFALASRSRHHRLQVVGTALFRFERSVEGGVSWNALNLLFNAARCIRANLPRRASSRISTRCRLSANSVKRSWIRDVKDPVGPEFMAPPAGRQIAQGLGGTSDARDALT